MLAESSDPIDMELLRCLRAWQDEKAARGEKRTLGREPGQIAKYGSIAVIESRVIRRSSGFNDGVDDSYESIVEKYPDKFSKKVVELAFERLSNARRATIVRIDR